AGDDRVQYRPQVGGRAGYYPQHFARCRLLLQRFGDLRVARLELLEQPHVFDRDDRLAGKSLDQLDLVLRRLAGLRPAEVDHADGFPVAQQGNTQHAAPGAFHRQRVVVAGVRKDVRFAHDRLRQDDAPADQRRIRRARSEQAKRFARPVVRPFEVYELAVEPEYGGHRAAAQVRGVLQDRLEHRRHIRRRSRNDAENFAGRCLLLQGLRQIAVARLQLLEQAHVLDGDHGLAGEHAEEIDLLLCERPHDRSVDDDAADYFPILDHRHREVGTRAAQLDLCNYSRAALVVPK